MSARLSTSSRRRGFTMVEAAIAVAVVGVLLTAATSTLMTVAKNRQIQTERRQGYELADQLMSEILQCYFQDPGSSPVFGPETGETRATYDDVDDYNGLSEAPPRQRSGTALTDYAGWKRTVAVSYVSPTSPASPSSVATSLKRIIVTVTSPSGKQYTLVGLRSQYGAYELSPLQQTNYVTWTGVNLQVGSVNKTIRTGAHPLNITTSQ